MGSDLAISGAYHGWRLQESSQVGWQKLPAPESDIVAVIGAVWAAGQEDKCSVVGGSSQRYHCRPLIVPLRFRGA